MLQITQEQVRRLSELSRTLFFERAVQHLAGDFPEQSRPLGENGLRRLLNEAEQAALDVGLNTERAVIVFASLALIYGSSFMQSQPWAGHILLDADLTALEKVDRLSNYL